MRAPALLLPILAAVLLACKSDTGDDTGGSSSGDMCSDDIIGDADPNYPPCTCDFKCEGAAECRFTSMSSICKPECVDDADCPSLAGLAATCNGGHCTIYCGQTMPCPTGYVCIENISCQAER